MKTCLLCQRPMRPRGASRDDFPGTVRPGARGLCGTCTAKPEAARFETLISPAVPVGTPCLDCERPLRPSNTTLVDHPGTVARQSDGLCWACHRRRTEGPGKAGPTEKDHQPITITGLDDPDPQVRAVAQQAQGMLDARRRRGIPPQGTGAHETDTKEGAA